MVAPAETVTLAGTVAAEVLLLASVTTAPPVGATPFNVTVPVEVVPPINAVGLKDTDDSAGELTVNVVLCVPLYVPEIVTGTVALTAEVATVKAAVVAPAKTVTLAGTVAAEVLLLTSVTTAPPIGAATFNTTVPVEEFPPTMAVGLAERDEIPVALNEIMDVFELPFSGQVHVPFWLPIKLTLLSAMAATSVAVPPFRMAYPAIFSDVLDSWRMDRPAMIRSLAFVVTMVGVA